MFESIDRFWEALRPWVVPFVPEPEKVPGLIGGAFDYGLKALALYAVLITVKRLPLIKETLTSFIEARGNIWDFKNTIAELSRLEPIIASVGNRLERLTETLDVIRSQNLEAQLESSADRTEVPQPEPTERATISSRTRVSDDANWANLRRLYLRNMRRLQAKVETIEDGRTYNAYARIGWRRPKLMVQKLGADQLITGPVANASLKQIAFFNTYKFRQAPVTDEIVGAMTVLDEQLERELGPAPPDDEL